MDLQARDPTKTYVVAPYMYEIATTTVEAMERKVSGYLRRWLGVPPLFTSIELYSNSIQLSLPVPSVVEDF